MQPTDNANQAASSAADVPPVSFGSNAVRLSPRQCVVAAVILAALCYWIPVAWRQIEPLEIGSDYRLPFRLGYDYWTFERYCGEVAAEDKTLLIGDSVVWGHYVSKAETLSHYLNEEAGEEGFANLGVDGIHPAAMEGLMCYYGRDVENRDVILHCNLLWICSEDRDLQSDKERTFNHPRLVPQFYPRIACYRESLSGRLGIVVERHVPLLAWASHLRIAYFDDSDLPRWTIDHPYKNPARAVTLELPSPDEPPSDRPVAEPWTEKDIVTASFPWVELDTSLQWGCFKRTVAMLRQRGNRVFVLVGPLNEHLLTPTSARTYAQRKGEVEAWLKGEKIPHCIASMLPSRDYADASHPLAEGYARLAKELFAHKPFVDFLSCGQRKK